MAQNITIAGATYSDVPGVEIPKSGGGTAYFPDTSTDTVTPASLLQGYTAHDAAGQLITGTASPEPVSASPKAVNFYDYDGTILHSYTAAEFAELSAMPSNPSHSGLTAQGWNWTLSNAKTYVAANGSLDIGQMYITDDGKTRLYIRIAAPGRMTVPLYYSQTVSNGVTVDWGDGSATTKLSGTGNKNTSHIYTAIGDYVITLTPVSGCTLGLGDGSSSRCVLGSTGNNGRVYNNMLQKLEIGSNMTSIGNYAFRYCYSLASITIPSGVTSIGNYAFYSCYPLSSVIIPSGVTSIGNYAFDYCYSLVSVIIPSSVTSIDSYVFSYCHSLARITIPSSVTSIGNNAFYSCRPLSSVIIPSGVTSIGESAFDSCHSLVSVIIPSSVTSIGNNAFASCYGMIEYHLKSTTPPTLSNTDVFSNMPSDCRIYVPAESLSSYQSATNWSDSTIKSNLVGE